MLRFLLAALVCLAPAVASAACSPMSAPPNSIGCQPAMPSNLEATDLVLGWRPSLGKEASRSFTPAQMLQAGLPGGFSTLLATGTITGQSNLAITGTSLVLGAGVFGNTLAVAGATNLASTLAVTGATGLASTLGVTGAATFSSTAVVTGTLTGQGSIIAGGSGAAPITLSSGQILMPASQSLGIRLTTAAQTITFGAPAAGLGNALTVTPNSNGNSLFGDLPNTVLVSNRLTASQIFSPATTYTLSGAVSPTSITGNGATVTVTFPTIAGVIIPVGSTVTTTGFTPSGYNETDKVVVTSTSTTLTYASTATGTMTVAGSMAYKMTPPDLIRFASNWAGEAAAVGAAFSPYEFTIPSDTALTDGTGHGAAVMNIAHNWSGAATGGKLGMQVSLSHTGATNDTGSQQHVVANMHAQSFYNAGGTGTGVLSHGTFYGLNPQVRLGYGATYWRLANTLGEIDLAVNATRQDITLGGTVTAGDAVTLTFASADIVGTPVAVSYTVGASQTLAMVANNLAAAVNNNTALRNARIGATSWEGSLKIYYYTHIATLTITPSTSGGATITAVKGTLTTGASVDFKTMATFIRLSDDDAPGSSGSALMVFGSSLAPSPSGQFEMGIAFNGHPAYHGSWAFSPSSTLIGSNLTTAVGFLDKSSPIPSNMSRYGIDWQYVNFTQASGGRAFRSSNFGVGGEGIIYSGPAVITPSSAGLSIDVSGKAASSVALQSGGGGGAGQVIGNYFLGDIGFDDYNGQYLVTGVNAGTGAVTTFTVLSPPSYPSGSAPSNPISVNGGSGRNWTVNATFPSTTILKLQPSGGNTLVGTGAAIATNSTSGFLLVPTMAGTPTGVVGAAGQAAIVVNTTGNKLCWSVGGGTWKDAVGGAC